MTLEESKERIAQLEDMLSRIIKAWKSIPEDHQVPEELNQGIMDEAEEVLQRS